MAYTESKQECLLESIYVLSKSNKTPWIIINDDNNNNNNNNNTNNNKHRVSEGVFYIRRCPRLCIVPIH